MNPRATDPPPVRYLTMTFTLPDGALAAGIAAIASAIVWAIRVITNKHLEVLNDQVQLARALLPLVTETANTCNDILENTKTVGQQLVRVRRAIKKLNAAALICEDCDGWYGEPDDCPDGMSMCRCSDPSPEITGAHHAVVAPPDSQRGRHKLPSGAGPGRRK